MLPLVSDELDEKCTDGTLNWVTSLNIVCQSQSATVSPGATIILEIRE